MATLVIAALAVSAAGATAARHGERYAAVDDDVSPAGGGALVPRFFIDEPKLAARDGAPCQADSHSCLDIGFPDKCCQNDHYCYVKPDSEPWCCQIGSPCDSACAFPRFQCVSTVPVTITPSPTSGSPASTVVTSTNSRACCGRRCTATSSFLCAEEFGGGCCGYGNTCASNKVCVRTVSQSTTATGLLTPVDPGCTATTQYACEDGGGCCNKLMHCTVRSGIAVCAPGNPTATDVNYDPNGGGNSGGLSSGAKTGIGVGVAVVGVGLLAFFAWFCLIRRRRRRRRRRGGATTASQRSGGASRVSGGGGGGGPSTIIGGGGGTSERPGRSARAMSEATRPTARRGATQDYFGPDAVAGPYTETETVVSDGAASTPGRPGGVPLQAHSPSDVVAPVEIDSRVKAGFVGSDVTPVAEGLATPLTTQGRFELYGSEMASPSSPSPPLPSPSVMTPRSVEGARSVSMMERSPGPAPSPEPWRR